MLDVRCFPSVQGFNARIFISGNSLPIGWGEGQGEGSSEILQSALDRLVVPKMRPARTGHEFLPLIAGLNCLRMGDTFPATLKREHGAGRKP